MFDAVTDRIAPGAAVTLRAPLGGPTGEPVEMLGRISRVREPGRTPGRIEIVLDVPWRGRLRVRFDPDGTGGFDDRLGPFEQQHDGARDLLLGHGHDLVDQRVDVLLRQR